MTKSNTLRKDQFKISITPLYQSKKNFVFNGKFFPFDFEQFKCNSSFFFKNKHLYENVISINILNDREIDLFKNITDKAIKDFISLCQNETCQINSSDVLYIQYLAHKYEVTELTKYLTNLISNNFKKLDYDSFLFQDESKDRIPLYAEEFTDVIAQNLTAFIKDDRILNFPVSILYLILYKYFNKYDGKYKYYQLNSSDEKEIIEDNNDQIIDFLFKCLKKYGKDASILFSLLNFEYSKFKDTIKKLLNDYQEMIDFGMIGNIIQKYAIDMEHKNAKFKKIFILLETSFSFENNEMQNNKLDKDVNNQKINIKKIDTNFHIENSYSSLDLSNMILVETTENV